MCAELHLHPTRDPNVLRVLLNLTAHLPGAAGVALAGPASEPDGAHLTGATSTPAEPDSTGDLMNEASSLTEHHRLLADRAAREPALLMACALELDQRLGEALPATLGLTPADITERFYQDRESASLTALGALIWALERRAEPALHLITARLAAELETIAASRYLRGETAAHSSGSPMVSPPYAITPRIGRWSPGRPESRSTASALSTPR